MSDLAVLLADLYPDRDKVRFLLRGVGVNPNRIDLEGDAVGRWERALEEASRLRRLQDIVAVASRDYPGRGSQLTESIEQYLDDPEGVSWIPVDARRRWTPEAPGLLRYYFDQWLPGLHRFLTLKGTLRMPREWAATNEYLRDLKATLDQGMREKTYLPLAAKPLPPTEHTRNAAFRDPFVSYVHQVILEIIGSHAAATP